MGIGKITVIGSINMDMVVKSPKLPSPGETILGGRFLMNPGGKGANQAVAAARLGGRVSFIGKIGNDVFGRQAKLQLENEKINIRNISIDRDNPSGVAKTVSLWLQVPIVLYQSMILILQRMI